MAAKHAYKSQIKYGDNLRFSVGKKSAIVIISKCVLKMPTSEYYLVNISLAVDVPYPLLKALREFMKTEK